ncbi:glutamate decarboxylase [Malassezia equina]|uniref:Glutamate decarboxylase n=1 Tax=Malassezia equina TaxID=1381935 RepID=A0AAF0EJH1_9BASI|nr:glutamate decarboxylase [Malassezia equina]
MDSPLRAERSSTEFQRLAPQFVQAIWKWIVCGEAPDTPVAPWTTPAEYYASMPLDLPAEGASEDTLMDTVQAILSNSINPWTYRFLEKLYTAPAVVSVLGDLLLGAMNASVHVFSASPILTRLEERCVQGLCHLFGYGVEADGVSMPGGAASNTLAVQTALSQALGGVYRRGGVWALVQRLQAQGRQGPGARPAILTSASAHFSVARAALAAGLGADAVVQVPVDAHGRMDVTALERLLREMHQDAAHPHGMPLIVCATSGTTVLGAFDDLTRIAPLCAQYQCWLHADASWGGGAIFSPEGRALMQGIEQANSLTVNPHKLLAVSHQCSFLLVRDRRTLTTSVDDAGYLFHEAPDAPDLATKTLGCGRRGEALKLYLVWLRYGTQGLCAHVQAGLAKARTLLTYVETHSQTIELGPLAEPLFLQICFRPRGQGSEGTRRAHARLAAQRYAVDFAPLPDGEYLRLVVHPLTSLETYRGIIDTVAFN